MKDRKKEITLLIIGILTLVSLVVGATYAFFKAQIGPAANFNVNTTTGTTDNLTFTTVGNILINASANNFAKGSEDLNGTIKATANLIANNNTNTTDKYYYNVYLDVIENELEYSSFTDPDNLQNNLVFTNEYDKTLGNNRDYNGLTKGYDPIPELYLTITGPNDYEYNISFPKATLKDDDDDSYDITELREGIYPLVLNRAIQVEATDKGTKKEDWQVKVTLKNLDSNQQLNTGKTFNAKVIIQAEKIPMNLMDVCKAGDNLAECIKELHDKSTYGASNLIYHDGVADYEGMPNVELEAGDKSYRYTGSYEKVNNYVCFGEKCSPTPDEDGYDNLYRIIGTFQNEEGEYETKLIKADYANKELLGAGSQTPGDLTQVNSETNGSYSGSIYQATNASTEEKDEYTHRYKGLLEHVDRYRWQKNETNDTLGNWPTSLLNKIHLNNIYYNKIDPIYQSLIINHDWVLTSDKTGWGDIASGANAKKTYSNELGENSTNQEIVPENIGLMYVSDYLYGAASKNWSKKAFFGGHWHYDTNTGKSDKYGNPVLSFDEDEIYSDYRSTTDSNWIYIGLWEWFMTQWKNIKNNTFFMYIGGHVGIGQVGSTSNAVRPTFYVTNEAKFKSGTGTASDPYIISQ